MPTKRRKPKKHQVKRILKTRTRATATHAGPPEEKPSPSLPSRRTIEKVLR